MRFKERGGVTQSSDMKRGGELIRGVRKDPLAAGVADEKKRRTLIRTEKCTK